MHITNIQNRKDEPQINTSKFIIIPIEVLGGVQIPIIQTNLIHNCVREKGNINFHNFFLYFLK